MPLVVPGALTPAQAGGGLGPVALQVRAALGAAVALPAAVAVRAGVAARVPADPRPVRA
jgi:hypothetical protein